MAHPKYLEGWFASLPHTNGLAHGEYPFSSYFSPWPTNLSEYKFSLFLADLLLAVGDVMNFKWINEGTVQVGKFCTVQGQSLLNKRTFSNVTPIE